MKGEVEIALHTCLRKPPIISPSGPALASMGRLTRELGRGLCRVLHHGTSACVKGVWGDISSTVPGYQAQLLLIGYVPGCSQSIYLTEHAVGCVST